MPECIVCKADYVPGELCPRCYSENDIWQLAEVQRQGCMGFLLFFESVSYLPVVSTAMALGFGLMGTEGAWSGIKPGVRLLAVLMTVAGSLFTMLQIQARYPEVREFILLCSVRKGWRRVVGLAVTQPLLVFLAAVLPVLALAFALVESDQLWELTRWLLFEPQYQAPPLESSGIPERTVQILPLVLMLGYMAFNISTVYSSSLLVVHERVRFMKSLIPPPIFLNRELLAEVVLQAAEHVLGGRISPRSFKRMADGGIGLIAQAGTYGKIQGLTDGGAEAPATYRIRADPWGHITKMLELPSPSVGSTGVGTLSPRQLLNINGDHWAVLVGINTYQDNRYGQLQVCVRDAEAIHRRLYEGGFPQEHIKVITDDWESPTRANIIANLISMAEAAKPEDLILFYFSGHGDLGAGNEPYLIARDTRRATLRNSGVPFLRVKEIMQNACAREKVIVLDSCHSGANIGGKGKRPMSAAYYNAFFPGPAEGLAILGSCKQGQNSYEWRQRSSSVFTYFLEEALSGNADGARHGYVTVTDVNRYVHDNVKLWAFQRKIAQEPTLQCEVAGDIVLSFYDTRYAYKQLLLNV